MRLDTLSQDERYEEIAELARDYGVDSKELWDSIVGDVVNSHLDLGELGADQDLLDNQQHLSDLWNTSIQEETLEKKMEEGREEDVVD